MPWGCDGCEVSEQHGDMRGAGRCEERQGDWLPAHGPTQCNVARCVGLLARNVQRDVLG